MKLWNEYRGSIILALAIVFCLVVVAGCATRSAPIPESWNDSDRFTKLHSQLEGAYDALLVATTPTVAGAQPLLSVERGRQIAQQLDKLKAAIDTADDIRIAGHGGYENPESLARVLTAIRAQIPEPSR